MNINNIFKKNILNNISLDLDNTGIVFLVGKSGAGKTTLFNVISGIDTEYTGEVIYAECSKEYDVDWYRKSIFGIVFQDFNLINTLTVAENIILGVQIAGKEYKMSDYNRIIEMLDIKEIESRKIVNLSGGEKQRVAIARALLRDDKIIFADEPSGSLDEDNTKIIFDYIKQISSDRLFIIITHDMLIANEYGDRILTMQGGTIMSDEDMGYQNNEKLNMHIEDGGSKLKKFNWSIPYSIKTYKRSWKKKIGIIFITTMALVCLLLVMGFSSAINNMYSKLDSNLLENDKYIVYRDNSNELFRPAMSNEDIEVINNNENVKYSSCFYKTNICVIYKNVNVDMDYDIYIDNDFYRSRFEDISGDFPEKNTDVIIDANLEKKLFGDKVQGIGKKILLKTYSGNQVELTVCGIKTNSVKEDGEIYINKELTTTIFKGDLLDSIDIYADNNYDSEIFSSSDVYDEEKILIGEKPKQKNEIVITQTYVNQFLQLMGETKIYSDEEILSGRINEIMMRRLIGKKVKIVMSSASLDMGNFIITGIVNDSQNAKVYMTEKVLNKVLINNCNVYVNKVDDASLDSFMKCMKEHNNYYEQWSKGKSRQITSKISVVIVGIAVITVIVSIMSAVMMHYFIKTSVIERRYEIGVLMSLGNKRGDIICLLLNEQIITSVIVSLLTIVCSAIIVVSGILDRIRVENVAMFSFEWWHILFVVLYSSILVVVCAVPVIVHSSKVNIVNLLRDKNNVW